MQTGCRQHTPRKKRKGDGLHAEFGLSRREYELVVLVCEGLINKEIAHRMGITEGTAKMYLSNVFHRVGVSNRSRLILWALQRGVVEVPPMLGEGVSACGQ